MATFGNAAKMGDNQDSGPPPGFHERGPMWKRRADMGISQAPTNQAPQAAPAPMPTPQEPAGSQAPLSPIRVQQVLLDLQQLAYLTLAPQAQQPAPTGATAAFYAAAAPPPIFQAQPQPAPQPMIYLAAAASPTAVQAVPGTTHVVYPATSAAQPIAAHLPVSPQQLAYVTTSPVQALQVPIAAAACTPLAPAQAAPAAQMAYPPAQDARVACVTAAPVHPAAQQPLRRPPGIYSPCGAAAGAGPHPAAAAAAAQPPPPPAAAQKQPLKTTLILPGTREALMFEAVPVGQKQPQEQGRAGALASSAAAAPVRTKQHQKQHQGSNSGSTIPAAGITRTAAVRAKEAATTAMSPKKGAAAGSPSKVRAAPRGSTHSLNDEAVHDTTHRSAKQGGDAAQQSKHPGQLRAEAPAFSLTPNSTWPLDPSHTTSLTNHLLTHGPELQQLHLGLEKLAAGPQLEGLLTALGRSCSQLHRLHISKLPHGASISPLSALTALTSLALEDSFVVNPRCLPAILSLRQLQSLSLKGDGCPWSAACAAEIAHCLRRLTSLDCSRCQLAPPLLGSLRPGQLRSLVLRGFTLRAEDLARLEGLPVVANALVLQVAPWQQEVGKAAAWLRRTAASLEQLSLGLTKPSEPGGGGGGALLAPAEASQLLLRELPAAAGQLSFLALTHMELGPAAAPLLAGLSELTHLRISHCTGLEDGAVDKLAGLPGLQNLSLMHNRGLSEGGAGVKAFAEALPQLTSLQVGKAVWEKSVSMKQL